jgi:hypothetical protein
LKPCRTGEHEGTRRSPGICGGFHQHLSVPQPQQALLVIKGDVHGGIGVQEQHAAVVQYMAQALAHGGACAGIPCGLVVHAPGQPATQRGDQQCGDAAQQRTPARRARALQCAVGQWRWNLPAQRQQAFRALPRACMLRVGIVPALPLRTLRYAAVLVQAHQPVGGLLQHTWR